MTRLVVALLLVIPLNAFAQANPTGACPFNGFASNPQNLPNLAKVATRKPAQTWLACDSPKGCFTMTIEPGSPVQIDRIDGAWTCGYGEDRHGAGPAWFRSKDLKSIPIAANPARSAWYGTWRNGEDRIVISPASHVKGVHLVGKAQWQGLYSQHFGSVRGNVTPLGNRLHYVEDGCTMDLTLAGTFLLASDNEGCGGLNVRFQGFWRRTSTNRVR